MAGDLERIEGVISEHAISIALMTKAVSSIESLLVQQTVSIKEIEKAMKSQELLMEKLSSLDSRMTDSINRIHKRIDINELDILSIKKEHKDACDIVKPMAQKGATVHSGMIILAKGLGMSIGAMMFFLLIWAIKASNYQP